MAEKLSDDLDEQTKEGLRQLVQLAIMLRENTRKTAPDLFEQINSRIETKPQKKGK